MLTGAVPFRDSNPMGIAHKHISESPIPPKQLRRDIPFQVQDVVLRALQKKREDRQRSAAQLAQELETSFYAAGIKLSTMGTNTPQANYCSYPELLPNDTLGERPTLRTDTPSAHSSDQVIDNSEFEKTLPADGAPAYNKSSRPKKEPRALPVQNASPESPVDITKRSRGQQASLRSQEGSAKNRKLYIIALAAVLVISAIIAVLALRPEEEKQAGPKPQVVPQGMVRVKGGTFKMGTDDSDALPQFRPAHDVTVSDFYLDINEVTNQEYQRFTRQTGHPAPPHWKEGEHEPGNAVWPVVIVSWRDEKA
jgi:serine/threonine-protein kinase